MELFKNFKDFKMDVLKEVGNIGAGNAATALSQLLGKPIDMAVPKVQLLSFEEITEKVGEQKNWYMQFSCGSRVKHRAISFSFLLRKRL